MHGANRLGGNSLSDLLVFGWLAGKGAAGYIAGLNEAPQVSQESVDAARKAAIAPLNRETGENPYLIHEALQDIMHEGCNIIREAEGLQSAIERLVALKARIANVQTPGASQYNPGWHEAIALTSMITVSEAVARAGLLREESRGAHTRLDFEGERSDWSEVNIVTRKGADGQMEIRKEARGDAPGELAAIARATLEELDGGIHV
jgi:succinate dehydrogenase / fumarate reductase flavoprotein subunit